MPTLFSFEKALATYKNKKPRPYQESCVKESIDALNQERDVIIQLPTGMGKTHTYLPIACNALRSGLRVCVLCPTKDNQKQTVTFSKDFDCSPKPSMVYGIEEYDCAITGERADYLICLEEREKCEKENRQCEVLKANRQYSEDKFVVTNFAKFLSVKPLNEFNLIVVDDSHGFENTVEQRFQGSVRYGKATALYEKYKNDGVMESLLGNFVEIFDDIYDAIPPDRLDMRISEDSVKRFAEKAMAGDRLDLLKHFKSLDAFDRPACQDIVYFIDACTRLTMHTFYVRKDFYARDDPDGAEVISRLSEKFQNLIVHQRFGNARVLFSSGTPGQPVIHARNCTFREYTSNGPVVVPREEPTAVKGWFKNLRIFEVEDMGSFKDPDTFPRSLSLTLEMLKEPQVKTLMLFKNYRGQEYAKSMIKKEIKREVGFIDDTFQPEEVKELVDKSRVILATASSRLWEGIDIKDLLLEIIFDLPYVKPPVYMDQYQAWRYSKRKMLMRLQQGIGRLIRRENDGGICVVFDSRFINRKKDPLFSEKLRAQVEPVRSAKLVDTVKGLLEEYTKNGCNRREKGD